MNINQLVYFVTVVKYNNITKAAKELYISQPAISLAIKDLEKEFGLTLFKRKNNVLTLTQHGKYLYDLSMPLIQEYNNVNERMNDYINKHSTLNLGIPPMLGTFLFHQSLMFLQMKIQDSNSRSKNMVALPIKKLF